MAVVYLAEDLRHHRQVALKVLLPELAAVVGAARFAREIEIAASLSHPHILPLHDSGEAGGFLFYVMPYVEGESLRDRLKREKQLPVDEALRIAREVSDALSYAHQRGVVHRDIKPENILLQAGHAVVADFGIARAVSAAGGESLTQTGMVVGTPAYMSPEQAAGADDVDGRSDLYAVACVLYEMLAGQPPFTGPTVESVVRQHLAAPAPSVTALRPAVPAHVVSALSRALAKVPADRFNPVAQFAEALGQPAPSLPRTSMPVAAAARTPRWWIAAAAVLVVAVVGGLLFTRTAQGDDLRSLIVLPLENQSGAAEQSHFVNGMHAELIGELGKIAALSVKGRTTAMAYGPGSGKTIRDIASELGVGAVIEGSVFRDGDSVRIQVSLIRSSDEEQIWSASYSRDARQAIAVLGEVARTIASQVRAVLTPDEAARLGGVSAMSSAAQDQYLAGREQLYRRDADGIRGSIESFREALRHDSLYAPAWAGLGASYTLATVYGVTPAESLFAWAANSLVASSRAIDLDPNLAEGHAARGYLGLMQSGPRDQTGRDLRRALAIKPNYAEGHGWLAQHYISVDSIPAARHSAQRARDLDPRSVGMRLAWVVVAFAAGDYAGALAVAREVSAITPANVAWEAQLLAIMGRGEECLALDLLPVDIRSICLGSARRYREADSIVSARVAAGVDSPGDGTYFATRGRLDDMQRSFERYLRRSPYSGIRLEPAWFNGGRVPPSVAAAFDSLRSGAWARVVAESRGVRIP